MSRSRTGRHSPLRSVGPFDQCRLPVSPTPIEDRKALFGGAAGQGVAEVLLDESDQFLIALKYLRKELFEPRALGLGIVVDGCQPGEWSPL